MEIFDKLLEKELGYELINWDQVLQSAANTDLSDLSENCEKGNFFVFRIETFSTLFYFLSHTAPTHFRKKLLTLSVFGHSGFNIF